MDDAFAGGVCRCKYCGTIQTVPGRAKASLVGAGKKSGRTLYSKRTSRSEAVPSSGLDELAQAVVSSGLSSSRLRGAGKRQGIAGLMRRPIVLVSAGAAIGCAAMILWLGQRGAPETSAVTDASAAVSGTASAGGADAAALPMSPNFLGLPIQQHTVVYVLDRGSGTTDLFSYLKEATFRSIESLGDSRRFQIIFWNNGTDDSFPVSGPTSASAANVQAARNALDGIYAHGLSDITSALKQAMKSKPEAVFIVTGKGPQLDDAFVDTAMSIRDKGTARFYTIDLGSTAASPPLAKLAKMTFGEAYGISESQLKQFAR